MPVKNRKAYYQKNRERIRKYANAWARKKYKQGWQAARNRRLKYDHGITARDYDLLFAAQQGKCAICHQPQLTKALAVDHNHTTGKVRALLCNGCNTGLGSFKENRLALSNAIAYLDFYEEP